MARTRNKLLITGAAGGMGRACARLLGGTHDLVLTDIAEGPLDAFAQEIEREGYTVISARAGDLIDQALLAGLIGDIGGDLPFQLIHTAGLSPSLGDWKAIMTINLIATEQLLNAVEPALRQGSAAVIIASTAGHLPISMPGINEVTDTPGAADFLDRIGPMIDAIAAQASTGPEGISYALSKAAVIRQCERRASAWGARGARIMTISPGLILTPMGRSELEKTAGAAETRDAAPVGRAGTSMDIALAAQFLLSDSASFITGSDLKVDGGSVAVLKQAMGL